MPVIDVDKAREWAKERWPSPVVRRQVDFLLTNCPRTKEIPKITCGRCKHSGPGADDITPGHDVLVCHNSKKPVSVWDDSTCDDAEEREE